MSANEGNQPEQSLQESRQQAADRYFEGHDIESESGQVEDAGGWSTDGDTWSRTLYFTNTEFPDGPTVRGHFELTFSEGSADIVDGHSAVTGKPEPANSDFSL